MWGVVRGLRGELDAEREALSEVEGRDGDASGSEACDDAGVDDFAGALLLAALFLLWVLLLLVLFAVAAVPDPVIAGAGGADADIAFVPMFLQVLRSR